MTSQLTSELTARGQADQRRRDIEWFRYQAKKARLAYDPAGDGDVTTGIPALPASFLERAAALLEECPVGDAEN